MKIGLGTAQFGLDYGVSNRRGRTPADEVARIVAYAAGQGIELIDTAAGYGASEAVLGAVLEPGHAFRIVTKTPAFATQPVNEGHADQLERSLTASLGKLRTGSVHGLLLHRADDLSGPGGTALLARLQALKQTRLVQRIGVSVYDAAQIDAVLDCCEIDLIQLPFSLFDQRLLHSGHLARLKRRGIEVHARSAFLQGLLLMQLDQIPAWFAPIRSHLASWHAHLDAQGVGALNAALGFVQSVSDIDSIVCGVNDCAQLAAICAAARAATSMDDSQRWALHDPLYLNPANWKT